MSDRCIHSGTEAAVSAEESGFELLVPLVDAALDALADDLALELRCRVDEEFVPDSPLEEAVYCEPVSEVGFQAAVEKAGFQGVMDDNGSVETLFWARISWNLVFGLGRLSRYFCRKPLKSFPVREPKICPLVNLPSIKRAGPTTRCPDAAKNLILFNNLRDYTA
jgi:hypothetical protein